MGFQVYIAEVHFYIIYTFGVKLKLNRGKWHNGNRK